MIVVIDNVLPEDKRLAVKDYFSFQPKEATTYWHGGKINYFLEDNSPLSDLVKHAAKFIDVNNMVGSEYWTHYGTKPDWHVDKDEKKLAKTGEISLPLCVVVYYPIVENLLGGKFMTRTEVITPKTNRAIIMSSDIEHMVEDYSGNRMSVAVNIWDYVLEEFK